MILAKLHQRVDLMMIVFFAGTVGAVVNNYFRLASISESPVALAEAERKNLLVAQMYVSILIAGILAFVVYGIFAAGLVQGELFPSFGHREDTYGGLTSFLDDFSPDKNQDAAKAIIWAFIAGLTERMVPNMLDTVVRRTEKPNPGS